VFVLDDRKEIAGVISLRQCQAGNSVAELTETVDRG
jgi:hypothetical protein